MTRDEAEELESWIVSPDAESEILQSDTLEDESWFVRVYGGDPNPTDLTDPEKGNLPDWMCEF